MKDTKRIVYLALLVAQAVVISTLEGLLPAPFAFAPGAKLGLANLITVVAIFTLKKREVATFVFLRLMIQMLLTGGASVFIYSCAGVLLSVLFMYAVKSFGPKKVSVIGISCVGGFFHNVGQLVVASMIATSPAILNYLPFMSILGILAGLLVGIGGNFLLTKLSFLEKQHLLLHGEDERWLR